MKESADNVRTMTRQELDVAIGWAPRKDRIRVCTTRIAFTRRTPEGFSPATSGWVKRGGKQLNVSGRFPRDPNRIYLVAPDKFKALWPRWKLQTIAFGLRDRARHHARAVRDCVDPSLVESDKRFELAEIEYASRKPA